MERDIANVVGNVDSRCRVPETAGASEEMPGEGPDRYVMESWGDGTDGVHSLMTIGPMRPITLAQSRGQRKSAAKRARKSTAEQTLMGPVSSHPALLKKTDGRRYKPQENLQGTFESKPSSDIVLLYMMIWMLECVNVWYVNCVVYKTLLSMMESTVDMDVLGVGEEKRKPFAMRLQEKIATLVRVRKGLTVDSGAADHVMPAGWLSFLRIRPSAGSKSGLHYVAANNARMPNQGQSRLKFMSSEGTVASILFQIAAINKPLVSVSKLIDEGHEVIFRQAESFILHKESGKNILLKRERGVFIIDAFASPTEDFSRRG